MALVATVTRRGFYDIEVSRIAVPWWRGGEVEYDERCHVCMAQWMLSAGASRGGNVELDRVVGKWYYGC